MTVFIKMLKDESGASAAEYALILGGAIGNAMNSASNCINLATTAACN